MRVGIRVRPGASRIRVGGSYGDDLVVAVTAVAVDGRATRAALDAVADAFGVRSRFVKLISGERSRSKVVEIDGDEAQLTARLQELLEG
jgi:hypothetical protein